MKSSQSEDLMTSLHTRTTPIVMKNLYFAMTSSHVSAQCHRCIFVAQNVAVVNASNIFILESNSLTGQENEIILFQAYKCRELNTNGSHLIL